MRRIPKMIQSYLRNKTKLNYMVIDAISIALTYTLAITILRLHIDVEYDYKMAFTMMPVVIVVKLLYYYIAKVYHLILVNVGLDEVVKISSHIVISNFIIVVITLAIPNFEFIPEIFFIYTTLFEIFLVVSTRILRRLMKMMMPNHMIMPGKRTLIIGAGPGGKIVLNEIRNNPKVFNNPIAFVDDDKNKIGQLLSGYEILGPVKKTPQLIDELKIQEVIIAISNIDQERFLNIIQMISSKSVKIKRIPQLAEYKEDQINKILDVNVEDLL
ncbi:MAG TPA: hypothetical protein VJ878_03685, partial [Candidatus Izemoplasmatales bacterium]|nr:hypothetical protein [Candidatus Izemoplasmatales bacterium]